MSEGETAFGVTRGGCDSLWRLVTCARRCFTTEVLVLLLALVLVLALVLALILVLALVLALVVTMNEQTGSRLMTCSCYSCYEDLKGWPPAPKKKREDVFVCVGVCVCVRAHP